MPIGDLERVNGPGAGRWFRWKFGEGYATVCSFVPELFEAYARVFHPARDAGGEEVTWAEVARRLGRVAHPEMQWHQLVGTADEDGIEGSEWDGQIPAVGEMPTGSRDRLCRILAGYTTDPFHCFFGVSEKVHPGGVAGLPGRGLRRRPLSLNGGRRRVIVTGPIEVVDRLIAAGADPSRRVAPNLIWPEDHAWFVVTEDEYDSTLVGGSRELIEALLGAPGLEALEVTPGTKLHAFADQVNLVPDAPPRSPFRRRRT